MKFRINIVSLVLISAALVQAQSPGRVPMPYGQEIFVSGINVAWDRFGGDVGQYPLNEAWFAEMLQGVADSGGNAVRWWLFTDCSNDPQFDPVTKLVSGLAEATVANIRKVLDMGYAYGVGIDLCLLSFDMMKTGKTNVDIEANKMILQTDDGLKAFIDNAVVPLVRAIGNHPAIVNWEIFNEPEGMVQSIAGDWGSMETGIEMTDVQRVVNRVTGAIHRTVPGVPVSNGCWAFIAGSNTIDGDHNYYSDSALVEVGGDPDGTLDYYMVHYYEWAGTERSPFHHPASYWGLDKPLVIGEFPAKGLSAEVGLMTPAQCWNYLMDNGYAGALGWTYTAHDGFGGLPEAGEGMRALKTSASEAVTLDFPPTANDDWYADTTDKVLTVAAPGILTNDREPTAGQTLSALVLSPPSHGALELGADGSFRYTPEANWSGTDKFRYAAIGGGGASDTGMAVIRVLDPAKSAFFAPPVASQWGIYAEWGQVSLEDLPTGMGMNNAQWGSPWTWIVGERVPIELSTVEQTISVQVKNDPASPWAQLKFHLTTAAAVEDYGPTDTTSAMVTLTAQPTGNDGFREYRGTITPSAAGAYLPTLQFVWQNPDGDGPKTSHQSVVRDFEICPSEDFVLRRFIFSGSWDVSQKIRWKMKGRTLEVTAPGKKVKIEVFDLRNRRVARKTGQDGVRWIHSGKTGVLIVRAVAGKQRSQFIVPTIGNLSNTDF